MPKRSSSSSSITSESVSFLVDLTLTDLLGEDSELIELVLILLCSAGGGGGGGVLAMVLETFKLDFGLFFSLSDFLGEDCLVSLMLVDFFGGDFDLETATIGFCSFFGELLDCLLASIDFLLLLRLVSGEAEARTLVGTASVSSYPLSFVDDASASELSSTLGSNRLLLSFLTNFLSLFLVGLFDLILVGLCSLVTVDAAGFFHIDTIVSLTSSSLTLASSSSSSSNL